MAYLAKNGAILTISGDPIVAPVSGDSSVNNRPVQTVTPTESQQIVSYSSPYTGLEGVIVTAISSTYIGSEITNRTSSDLTASGATVNVPAGYYEEAVSKSVTTMTLPTSAAASSASGYTSKATISRSTSDQYINIPPGYNTAGGYYKISAVTNGSVTNSGSVSGSSATISTGTNTLTLTKSIEITPNVTAGYISSGTAGSVSVALTASVTTKAAATYTPTTTSQTIAANTYLTGIQTIAAIPSQYIVPSGTKSITTNGTGIDVTQYAAVDVAVPTGSAINNKPSQTITPTESQQTIGYSSPYTGLEEVIVDAISSTYVGSGISRKSSTDLTVSGATITAPAGYYSSAATKSVASGTAGTPSATKSAVSNHSVSITPSVTNTAGYISGGTKTGTVVTVTASEVDTDTLYCDGAGTWNVVGAASFVVDAGTINNPTATKSAVSNNSITVTPHVNYSAGFINTSGTRDGTAVTVSASELVSGTLYCDDAGNWDVTNAETFVVDAGTATAPSTISGTSATVSTGTNTITLTKTVSVTPSISVAGYISSGTAGNASISLTASVTTKAAATYYPSTSDQTISASQYLTGAQTIKAVVVSGLDASKILSGTTVNIGDSADADRITSVTGNVTFKTYYTGSGAPSSSLGSVGDIYLQTS